MTEEPNHQNGFKFLRRSAIDQHIDVRNRWDDLIPVIKRYPNLLGIGISEDTAIIVKGDLFEVIGKSRVAVHDNTQRQRWEKPYDLLGAGDIYNMKTRQVVTYGDVRNRLSTEGPTGTGRPRSPSGGVVQESRPAATAPPAGSSRLAAPSGTAVGPGDGRGAVPASIPLGLPRLVELLLMTAGDDASWWQIEVFDVDSDGEIDLLRIHLLNGDTVVWQMRRSA
jgi:hypothetical protein